MQFEIVLAPSALQQLRAFRAYERAAIVDGLEVYLRHRPTLISGSRIKRLRDVIRPQYRLRVGEVRIFYDVTEQEVQVLAIVAKSQAAAWLESCGEAGPSGSAG